MDFTAYWGADMTFDHYVYPGTNILANKQGITDKTMAYDFERNFSLKRVGELRARGITGRFDAAHLQSIHKFLFQDVYDWAGEFRDIEIFKGMTEFIAPDLIRAELDEFCGDIRDKNYFRGLSKPDAADAMADAMCWLNLIHPFREGNGRTQRVFMEQLAANAGYDLDFSNISENDMRDASFAASVRGENRLMRYLFRSNMTETGVMGPVEHIMPAPDRERDACDSKPKRVAKTHVGICGRAIGSIRHVLFGFDSGRDVSDLDSALEEIERRDAGPGPDYEV